MHDIYLNSFRTTSQIHPKRCPVASREGSWQRAGFGKDLGGGGSIEFSACLLFWMFINCFDCGHFWDRLKVRGCIRNGHNNYKIQDGNFLTLGRSPGGSTNDLERVQKKMDFGLIIELFFKWFRARPRSHAVDAAVKQY